MKSTLFVMLAVLAFATAALGQNTAKRGPSFFTVEIAGAKPISVSLADIAKYPRTEVRGKDHDGKESVYSGIELRELLKPLGVKFGTELRGRQLAHYLLVEGSDGHRVVYAIAELDPEFSVDPVIIADTQNGKPLADEDGTFQIIAPADKRHGRWVRQVAALKVVSVANDGQKTVH